MVQSELRNVMLLNRGLGFLLGGGAYQHKTDITVDQVTYSISHWLPLCNNGVQRMAEAFQRSD